MEWFFILLFVWFIVFVATRKSGFGNLGCLVLIIVFVIWLGKSCSDYEQEDRKRQESLDSAVERIHKTKQMYIDSGWVKPPRM